MMAWCVWNWLLRHPVAVVGRGLPLTGLNLMESMCRWIFGFWLWGVFPIMLLIAKSERLDGIKFTGLPRRHSLLLVLRVGRVNEAVYLKPPETSRVINRICVAQEKHVVVTTSGQDFSKEVVCRAGLNALICPARQQVRRTPI